MSRSASRLPPVDNFDKFLPTLRPCLRKTEAVKLSIAVSRAVLSTALLSVPTASLALEGTWIRTYAGGYGHSVHETRDGGVLLGGTFGATSECCQPWLMKLEADGSLEWQLTYAAPGLGGARNVVPTRDGGYLMAGDGAEFIVLKLDHAGLVVWARSYGDGGYANGGGVMENEDGTILVVGSTSLGDGLSQNGRAMLLDPDGNVLWDKAYGRPLLVDFFTSAVVAYDGNFLVAGSSVGDYWVVELDRATGAVVWQSVYGGPFEDAGLVVAKVLSDRYLVVGASDTFSAGGLRNWWALILDQSGKVLKEVSLGGADAEDPHTAIATSDGGFLIGGGSASFSGGFGDIWLVKFDSRAEIVWQKAYGFSSRSDTAHQVLETESGYAIVGDSYSYPVEYEVWLMSVDRDGNVEPGSCGTVYDTSAIPWQTNAPARAGKAKTWDIAPDAVDMDVTATRLALPVEACISN